MSRPNLPRPGSHSGPDRLPPIDSASYTSEQALAAKALTATPRGEVRGPFIPLLYSPHLLDHTQKLGAFIRYDSSIPQRLREFAILVTARFWEQAYEWHVHAALAIGAGVTPTTIDALAENVFPATAAADERIVWHFCTQVHQAHCVDDTVYGETIALLGAPGTVELTALCGYYAMLAMVLNVARTPCPGNAFATPGSDTSGG